jgi:Signal transduction histidine kinase
MLLVAVIIITVFAGLTISNVTLIQNRNAERLRSLLNASVTSGRTWQSFYVGDTASVFLVELWYRQIYVTGFVDAAVPAEALIAAVLAYGGEEGILPTQDLRFASRPTFEGIRIAFSDYGQERSEIRSTIAAGCGFAVLTLLLFFAVSRFLSAWALRPVEKAWQQQRRFLSDASHELKTPLAVVMANTNILLTSPDERIQVQEKWLKSTEFEVERMKDLVEQMLFLARSEEDGDTPAAESVNLSALLEASVLSFEALAFEAGASIEARLAPELFVLGSGEKLRRMADILLDNAVKYATGDKRVRLTLEPKDGFAVLAVRNPAALQDPAQTDQLFDRFYRAEESRSTSGYGLGLSIAKAIAESHSGSISAHYATGEMTFQVNLPL